MKSKTTLHRMFILLITLMSAIGANAQEAYANYTPSNTTLTFYYDNLRSTRTGTTYDLNTGSNDPDWYTDGNKPKVAQVVFDPSFAGARPTSTYKWFDSMSLLEFITGMNYLNTSEVTRMDWMFYGCYRLTNIDLSSFNTSKVTDMGRMFSGCSSLTSLDLSAFNTSNITVLNYMFTGCRNLRTIYVSNGWNTDAAASVQMFKGCSSLVGEKGTSYDENYVDGSYAHIDGGHSNPGYFRALPEAYACYTESNTTLTFYYDGLRSSRPGTTYNLNTDSNFPGWYTHDTYANVTKVVIDPFFADARPTTTYSWFSDMNNLETIEGMNYLNTSEVTNMVAMFKGCVHLTYLDLSSFNTSKVTNMNAMFYNCSSLQIIFVDDGWTTAAVTKSSFMFTNCTSLLGGKGTYYNDSNPTNKTYAHIDGGPSNPGYLTAPAEAYACYTPTNTTLTFYFDNQRDSREGTTYDLNTSYNRTGWDIDDTKSNVTKVVFDPSFAVVRPTTTSDWFYSMCELKDIEGINYLNTSKVTDMAWMFLNCTELTSLDLSHFNTSKVTYMNQMFDGCSSLTSLDLSSFNTSKVIGMIEMFNGCCNLQTIYIGEDWSTAAVKYSENMFYNCTSLVGGKGTTYNDSNPTDVTYAHIDGGTSNPGYFTAAGTKPYACYTPGNTTLTFYYDNLRGSRGGTTYDLNLNNYPRWASDATYDRVTEVVFDPSFASARPTSTYAWFYGMTNLTNITGMNYLNTSKVTNMNQMFYYCSSLKSLDISHFNTSEVTDMNSMFYLCTSLRTIYVGDGWNTEAVMDSRYMFQSCPSLMGGKGTIYNDSNPKDKTYAHIDGGPGDPGYFRDINTGIATDLHQVTSDKQQVQSDEWYTIDGRKLNGMPAKKGVYIQNGKKTVVK